MTSDLDHDPRSALYDVAAVHTVRGEIRPLVERIVTELGADPLGDDTSRSCVDSLSAVLASERAVEGRAARDRVIQWLARPQTEQSHR